MATARLKRAVIGLILSIILIVVAIRIVLRVPGIPYNVRELFLDHASTSALVFFALTMLWIGAGAMLLAQLIARVRWPWLFAPLALIAVCLVSKMLLSRSVTYESIDDIIGSNTLFGIVTRNDAWGPWWARAFPAIGSDIVDFLERRVRYAALYSMPIVAITMMLVAGSRTMRARLAKKPRDLAWLILSGALWLWLARTIVVPWAGTDNLTELLPQHPPLGIVGEWYLFAIALLIGVNVSLILSAGAKPMRLLAAATFTFAALPLGWLLLNLGLDAHVEKYGAVFSGAQFLLGPDRTHALSQAALVTRWAVLQLAAVAVTFTGAWVAHCFCDIAEELVPSEVIRRPDVTS